MRVIGTAGHVDHGKSTLVQALTGIDPDRLKEERERQMTIDLGFAWLRLPDGDEVGVIDVPGHRDFIENMLAGVGGIDAALLVVAADEGVMPQTREHLAILDLLEVERGVVALTKVDVVDDPAWLELVREEVRGLLSGTCLREAPIVGVSAKSGQGISDLLAALDGILRSSPSRPDLGRPRLPIDRAFTLTGFGTIVTGTLIDGTLEVGQEVVVLPGEGHGRIRGLQTHKAKVARAVPGSRTAANVAGIDLQAVTRGDVLTTPGAYRPTRRLDVRFRMLADAPGPMRHDQRVKIFVGSAQRMARVRLLGADALAPGQAGWLQLVLEAPVVAAPGDHFILRQPSPGATLGGGRVVDAEPVRLHRRRDAAVLEALERRLRGTPAEVLEQALVSLGPIPMRKAVERARLDPDSAAAAAHDLLVRGRLLSLGGGEPEPESDALVAAATTWEGLRRQMHDAVQTYHDAFRLRAGMPPEELKSRLGFEPRTRAALLEWALRTQALCEIHGRIGLPGRQITLTGRELSAAEALLARFRQAPAAPPSFKECVAAVGEELLGYLLESRQLVQASAEVVFAAPDYDRMVDAVQEKIRTSGSATVADIRDLFQTSRKFALALLEHLDAEDITVRQGDVRRLKEDGGQASG
jgi:selenocysteine-specific elongation factor